ncbi:MAG: SusC/RagA family TonB-linked outer membrane protein [Gemmatimonadota bacterium]|nr:SusC/RagA family TonB-linked outer membrane protein [Gemmatimonadota bacterium]
MLRARSLVIPLLAMALATTQAAAQRRITGRVTDLASGEGLPGATVTIVGTTIGTMTNENGAFALNAPAGPATLLVRRISFKRATIEVGVTQTEANVGLVRDVLQLETQVITGAATSVARQNAANDVGVVTSDQLSNVPAQSVENALQGKVAGLSVSSNSGAPGGGNQVRLRGVTSVFGSSDPLYVVDGVIVSNDALQPGTNAITSANRNTSNATNQDNGVNRISDLNPNDIESVEVLKGASASAIYGSKASNGVIIVKTKTGTSGRTRLNTTVRIGTFDLENKYGARRYSLAEAETKGIAAGMSKAQVDSNFQSCNGFCDFEQQLYGEHQLAYEENVSLSGGSTNGRTSYFASGMNKFDGGIEKGTDYKKQSLRLNLSQLIGDRFAVQINNNLIRTVANRGISNNDNSNITPYFVFAGTPSFFDMRPRNGVYPTNPFAQTNVFQDRDFLKLPEEVYRLISNANATFDALQSPSHSLQLRVAGGVDQFSQQNNIVSPPFLYFEPNDGLPGTLTQLNGNVLHANADFTAVHRWFPAFQDYSFTTSAGVQREISRLRSLNIVTRNTIPGQENPDQGSSSQPFANREEIHGLAFFGQEEFLTMGERLLLTAGTRAERSTVNGDINKFYFFPKGSASYRFHTPASNVDELKLRIAAGQSGNQPLYLQKFSPAFASGTYDGQNTLQAGPAEGDSKIKPERQTEIETGFDITGLSSRASLSFTWYQKTINDVILHITTAPSLGSVVRIQNGGSIRNRGIEMLLTASPLQGDLSWVTHTTFARNRGIVTSLPAGISFFNVERDASGQRVQFGAGYGITRLEVGKSVTQIVATDATKGSDAQGNPLVVAKGDAAPSFTMGFGNDFTWKHLRLSFLFDWQHGGNLVNVTQDVYDAFGGSPKLADGGAARADSNDAKGISKYVQDASFVKLRELSISYELPKSFVDQLFLGRAIDARIQLSGRNLKTWTSYPGVDPEVSNFGSQQIARFIDLAPFPPSRSYFLTLAVGY